MKTLIVTIVLVLVAPLASATYCTNGSTNYPACNNREPVPRRAPPPQQQQQQQQQAVDLSLMNNPVANAAGGLGGAGGFGGGGSVTTGNTYALSISGGAAPLPAGTCPKGDSTYLQVLGGLLFTYAVSSTRTEFECLDRLLEFARATAPKPQPDPIINYLAPPLPAAVASVRCPPAKPVKPTRKPAKRACPVR